MKVERKESEFKPIVITLENQKEVNMMYGIMACEEDELLTETVQDFRAEIIRNMVRAMQHETFI